jgi:twitching motility protein PilT
MEFFDAEPIANAELESFIGEKLTETQRKKLIDEMELDCSISFGEEILRMNVFSQSRGRAISMRIVKAKVPPLHQLGFSTAINKMFSYRDGLILITGPTGSGKSTTIASIIDKFNETSNQHIITIEDPIEYRFTSKRCLINQREIGKNTLSYAAALRSALREDPDIIFVGEMRDMESVSIALTAAETGHLVVSTLHTIGAAKTIDRLIDVFPPNQQAQVRSQLSTALRAVVSQRLLPNRSGTGRVVAYEMMFVNHAIANLIRENKIPMINQSIQTGRNEGMITLNACLEHLAADGLITAETAAENKTKA